MRFFFQVWMPDTFFRNEKDAKFHDIIQPNLYVRVFPNGDVLYSIRVNRIQIYIVKKCLLFSFAHLGDGEISWITDKCPNSTTTPTTLNKLHWPYSTPALYNQHYITPVHSRLTLHYTSPHYTGPYYLSTTPHFQPNN